jgi:hypothetical protein
LVEANKKSFRKMFPHLAKELNSGESKISIDSVRTNPDQAEKTPLDKFHNYNPTVIDFLRRCTLEKEAHEIIVYLEKRNEITREHAQQLKKQLKQKGVRSFGPKKDDGYYFKQSGLC